MGFRRLYTLNRARPTCRFASSEIGAFLAPSFCSTAFPFYRCGAAKRRALGGFFFRICRHIKISKDPSPDSDTNLRLYSFIQAGPWCIQSVFDTLWFIT